MLHMRHQKNRDAETYDLIERLTRRAESWEKLARSARQRDTGPDAGLRECRLYPDGYWTGVAYGLETAAKELRALIALLDS